MGDIPQQIQALLCEAVRRGASDVHLEPGAGDCEIRFRVDGLLETHARVPADIGAQLVTRLMVMSQLLTYRRDVPQEGRASVSIERLPAALAVRVAIMPTTHGLRAAVRLPAELTQPRTLNDLALGTPAARLIDAFLHADSGVLLIVGPAGSGKTTTAYAILEALRRAQPGVSIVALEDPVERDLAGVTQIQVEPFGQLTYATALRSMLRQDPQVLMLGEIRDAETASLAVQAGLSGHRLLCTLHAADAAQAVSRLLEMQLAPYQIGGGLLGVISQRLLRRRTAQGYRGRLAVAEAVTVDDAWRRLIGAGAGSEALRGAYRGAAGFATLRDAAAAKVAAGETDAAEVVRVLGPE
ncbi:MAG: GspE/PulE family protein [Tepidisphaeraceae bacterium]